MSTPFTVGTWYAGSSITNGAGSPEKYFVFFSAIPEKITIAMPRKYIPGAINLLCGKKASVIIAMISVFAPQGRKVVSMMVILLSFSSSIVLEAIIAGTPQPVPTSIGMNDFPERPNLLNTLSMMKATLAI